MGDLSILDKRNEYVPIWKDNYLYRKGTRFVFSQYTHIRIRVNPNVTNYFWPTFRFMGSVVGVVFFDVITFLIWILCHSTRHNHSLRGSVSELLVDIRIDKLYLLDFLWVSSKVVRSLTSSVGVPRLIKTGTDPSFRNREFPIMTFGSNRSFIVIYNLLTENQEVVIIYPNSSFFFTDTLEEV